MLKFQNSVGTRRIIHDDIWIIYVYIHIISLDNYLKKNILQKTVVTPFLEEVKNAKIDAFLNQTKWFLKFVTHCIKICLHCGKIKSSYLTYKLLCIFFSFMCVDSRQNPLPQQFYRTKTLNCDYCISQDSLKEQNLEKEKYICIYIIMT